MKMVNLPKIKHTLTGFREILCFLHNSAQNPTFESDAANLNLNVTVRSLIILTHCTGGTNVTVSRLGASHQVNATNINENVVKAYGVSRAVLHF